MGGDEVLAPLQLERTTPLFVGHRVGKLALHAAGLQEPQELTENPPANDAEHVAPVLQQLQLQHVPLEHVDGLEVLEADDEVAAEDDAVAAEDDEVAAEDDEVDDEVDDDVDDEVDVGVVPLCQQKFAYVLGVKSHSESPLALDEQYTRRAGCLPTATGLDVRVTAPFVS